MYEDVNKEIQIACKVQVILAIFGALFLMWLHWQTCAYCVDGLNGLCYIKCFSLIILPFPILSYGEEDDADQERREQREFKIAQLILTYDYDEACRSNQSRLQQQMIAARYRLSPSGEWYREVVYV